MRHKSAIVVMTKYPTPGRVKTRLTPALTPHQAAAVHRAFLLHWMDRLKRLDLVELIVCFDPPDAEADFRALLNDDSIELLPQSTGDLGARLAAAASTLSLRFDHLLFVGVDSPDVPDEMIEQVLLALRDPRLTPRREPRIAQRAEPDPRIALAPTDDGGFWALGVTSTVNVAALCRDIEWSSGKEAAQTLARAAELGYAIAPTAACRWPDVDRPADLRRLVDKLATSRRSGDAELLSKLREAMSNER
jgi:rSAM/selenodomain-associated transferase 1